MNASPKTYKQYAVGDEIAVLDSNNEIHTGRVTSVIIERNGYPTTTVSLPSKNYNGGFAVERLYTVEEAQQVQAQAIADAKMFQSVTGWR